MEVSYVYLLVAFHIRDKKTKPVSAKMRVVGTRIINGDNSLWRPHFLVYCMRKYMVVHVISILTISKMQQNPLAQVSNTGINATGRVTA